MVHKLFLLKLFAIAACLSSVITANAYDFWSNGIYYNITDPTAMTVEVTDNNGSDNSYSGTVNIPSTVTHISTTYTVTRIGDYAFHHCSNLTNVTIPNSITSIGSAAFTCCPKLSGIILPDGVKSIEGGTFYECSSLKDVSIGNSVTRIGENAFYYCTSLAGIMLPNSVTAIGSSSFYVCNSLTNITIPNSVTWIGTSAFCACTSLANILIPNSTNNIGENAFSGTAWYNNQPDGLVYAGLVAYQYKGTMPNGKSINIKSGTVSISPSAFYGCSGLTSVTIPNSVTIIGHSAFLDCTNLVNVTIGKSVTGIEPYSFRGCYKLSKIICKAATPPAMLEGETFSNVGSATLYVPNTSMSAYQTAQGWRQFQHIVGMESRNFFADVNNDDEINIADVNNVINAILSSGSNASADVNADGEVNIADVNAVISVILFGGSSQDNHEYVDLGLPSGTLWATCNIGANSPEEYGDYFAWGETAPKEVYTWQTYKWCSGDLFSMTKYCRESENGYDGFTDGKGELDLEDV